ncbi:MAG: TetR/AcrR family transcriptional regulator [Clostridiales bacterium]
MPAIFNEQNREAVRIRMLENGAELLKKYGVKRMTVADIARASGLAKGTFYTFFSSKEEFIYQIILYKREMVRKIFTDLAGDCRRIRRDQLLEFFRRIQREDLNIYRYMTEQDMNYLATKWPREYSFNPAADEETTRWMLSCMEGLRQGINWKVLANLMKTLALLDMTKDVLHEDALEETRGVLRKGLLDYLFGCNGEIDKGAAI